MAETTDNTKTDESDGGSDQPRHPIIGCCSVLLVMFVFYIGIGGILARIESCRELTGIIVFDVMFGVAMVGHSALNTRRQHFWKQIIPVVVLGVMLSGMLIGWHCIQFHMRVRYQQESLERQPELPAELEATHPPTN